MTTTDARQGEKLTSPRPPLSSDELARAVTTLETGDLVVVPTSRWYMICADATNSVACQRIFTAKRRPATKQLCLVVPSLAAASARFAMNTGAHRLATALWPGDLAMLLRWRDTSHGDDHAAVGSPAALVTQAPGTLGALSTRARVPIAATTVNVSGTMDEGPVPAITVGEVRRFLTESGIGDATVIDGGICPTANHLTIVDCTEHRPRIVRHGVVHERAIAAALAA